MNWKSDVEELKLRNKLAKSQGGTEAIKLQHAKGRLTLRERIDLLLDKSSFDEVGKIAGDAEKDDKGEISDFTPSNFVLGFGKIDGRQVLVGGEDFTVKGGSPNPVGLRKSVYTEDLALQYKVPLIRLHEGGGGSVKGSSGKKSYGDPVFSKSRFLSVAKTLKEVPVATAALGPVAGLPASRFVASHFRVMTKKTAQVLIAGPKVVERAFGTVLTKEELGGSEVHKSNGVVDNIVDTEKEALNQIRKFISYFPQNRYEIAQRVLNEDDIERKDQDLLDAIPEDRSRTYDMRKILSGVVDRDSLFEITPYFGRGMITAFARLNGFSVGIFANDPNFYAGSMTADNAKKTTRFIQNCNNFNIPILTFVDEPGFLIGPEAEKNAGILYGTETVLTAAETTVPWATVMIRKSFGVAAAAHFGPDPYVLAWPSAESGALPLEGGVAVAFAKEIAAAEDPEAKRKEIEDSLRKARDPFARGESFSVHEVIDPRETRKYLSLWAERIQTQLLTRNYLK